jgi:hypothetical protein
MITLNTTADLPLRDIRDGLGDGGVPGIISFGSGRRGQGGGLGMSEGFGLA